MGIKRVISKISFIINSIKWFIQRGVRGYSDRDVWNLDIYIFKVLSGGLIKLAYITHGHPCPYPKNEHPSAESIPCTCAYRWDSDLREYGALFHRLAEGSFEGDDWMREEKATYQKSMGWLKENINNLWD